MEPGTNHHNYPRMRPGWRRRRGAEGGLPWPIPRYRLANPGSAHCTAPAEGDGKVGLDKALETTHTIGSNGESCLPSDRVDSWAASGLAELSHSSRRAVVVRGAWDGTARLRGAPVREPAHGAFTGVSLGFIYSEVESACP